MIRQVKVCVERETERGTIFRVLVPRESLTDEVRKFSEKKVMKGELRIDDGRTITAEQRRKAYATIRDIADYTGYVPEEAKERLKYEYMLKTDSKYFSLSDCGVSTAREFISFILDFALEWGISLTDNIINRTDDVGKALYSALKNRRCVLCGKDGEIHHVDAIGMGNNRKKLNDRNHRKICLCREHHTEAHTIGFKRFSEMYHVYGIKYMEDKNE